MKSVAMLGLAIVCMAAVAEASEPTVSDAHDFLRQIASSGGLRTDNSSERFKVEDSITYSGEVCRSTLTHTQGGNETYRDGTRMVFVRTIGIDWQLISSSKHESPSRLVQIFGPIKQSVRTPKTFKNADSLSLDIYTPDEKSGNRVNKAVNVLLNACASKSKFD